MAKTRFEPGPWKVISFTTHTGEEIVRIVPTDAYGINRGPGPVCEVFSQRLGIPDETCIANAHLIAVAPELYVTLEKAVESYGKPGGPWNCPDEPGAWLALAKAALAKAKGEESEQG